MPLLPFSLLIIVLSYGSNLQPLVNILKYYECIQIYLIETRFGQILNMTLERSLSSNDVHKRKVSPCYA